MSKQYNYCMDNQVKKDVKTLLVQEDIKLKELVELLTQKTGKIYSSSGLSHKLAREKLSYKEMLDITEILGYKIKFEKIEK